MVTDGTASISTEQDLLDVALAQKYRQSLTTLPTQSSFRVVALVFYECSSSNNDNSLELPITIKSQTDRKFVVGTNSEPGGFIGGAICAERAALVQLRFLPFAEVTKIVIVTDSEQHVPPGMLCREFMAGHSAVPWNVPIVLAGVGGAGMTKTTLRQLYPHPSPYARLTAAQANDFGKNFVSLFQESTTLSLHTVTKLMQLALQAARQDTRTELHPIQYGAAVLFEDDTTECAHQKKALEYGATLDAVSQLHLSKGHPVALVQVDSHGIAHAPFAPARALLSEHGYGDCRVLIHVHQEDGSVKLVDVAASDLAPSAPDIGDLWSE